MRSRELLSVTRRTFAEPRLFDDATAATRTATSHPFLLAALAALVAMLAGLIAVPAPAQAQEAGNVLLYTGTTGYRHVDAIEDGAPAVQAALEAEGFEVVWEDCNVRGTEAGQCQHPEANPSIFTEENLAEFDAIYFLNASDYWSGTGGQPGQLFTPSQEDAIIDFVQDGGGIGANHNATDMAAGQTSWSWWDANNPNSVVGTTMKGHAATAGPNGLPADVQVADRHHPSTRDLPDSYQFSDEHYNFSRNVRGDHHVLATLDERTYNPGNPMGQDHPISWCKVYDGDNINDATGDAKDYNGGRTWVTGMGHFGNDYTENGGGNELIEHIVGGISWLAGEGELSDCGGTVWSNFTRTVLVDNVVGPIGTDVAADGKVYWSEIGPTQGYESQGFIKMHDPAGAANNATTVATIPTRADHGNSEDGVLGMVLDPNFETNRYIYVYYSPRNPDWPTTGNEIEVGYNQISRFTLNAAGTTVEPDSERVILQVPKAKISGSPSPCAGCPTDSGPGHVGGAGLAVDSEGSLYLGVGDDVSPNAQGHGGAPPLDYRAEERRDARKTSANTGDLRGKIVRINPLEDIAAGTEPGVGQTYAIPEGNMFPEGTANTRPEIYAMGFRQPFTVQTDPANPGVVTVGEYAPDGSGNIADRAPAGIIEWNLVSEPGFYGWPYCTGDNSPANTSYKWDYAANASTGEQYDCSAAQIPSDLDYAPAGQTNGGTSFAGLPNVPGPAIPATVWKKYAGQAGGQDPLAFGPLGDGMEPVTGPVYRYDATNAGEGAFPPYYDGSWLIHNRASGSTPNVGSWKEVRLREDNNQMLRVHEWLPTNIFGAPNNSHVIPSRFGPDGALYMARWAFGCCRNQLGSDDLTQLIKISYDDSPQQCEDVNPPSVEHAIEGEEHPTEPDTYVGPATLSLTAEDVGCAGVDDIEYREAGTTEWQTYTEPVEFGDPGEYSIEYRASDNDDNVSGTFTAEFTVVALDDETAPTVSHELVGDQDGDLYVGSVDLVVNVEDEEPSSGIELVEYQIDGGEWQEYTDPVPFDEPGPHAVSYRATDVAGNTSETGSVEFRVVPAEACVSQVAEELSDEFDGTGTTLNPIWLRHTRSGGTPTSGAMAPTLDGGNLTMPTNDFELDGSGTTATGPVNFIGQDLPALGDAWEVETQFTIQHTGGWQHAGLIVWNGDNNLLRSTITNNLNGSGSPVQRTIFVEQSKDNPTSTEGARTQSGGTNVLVGDPMEPVTIRMRYIREDGANSLVGQYQITAPDRAATDGWVDFPGNAGWQNSGGLDLNPTGGARRDAAGSRIGLLAAGNFPGNTGSFPYDGEPAEMIVDYFRVSQGEHVCEETAPTTTATLSPASPGAGGTYNGPVGVSLSAADTGDPGASGVERTEYRVDGGEWQSYSDPFTVSALGAHTVDYRSTDYAANVEDPPGSVPFTIAEVSDPGPGPGPTPPGGSNPPVPPPASPAAEIDRPSKKQAKLAKLLGKGIKVSGSCSGVDDGKLILKASKKIARKAGLRKTTLAKARVSCGSNGTFTTMLKAKGKTKKALADYSGKLKAKLKLTMSAASGQAVDVTKVTLKGGR